MKLALYLPNFRDKVTIKELEELTALAEELDFDSVWTLDRIVVPEASDRGELQHSFGMMEEFPKQLQPLTSERSLLQETALRLEPDYPEAIYDLGVPVPAPLRDHVAAEGSLRSDDRPPVGVARVQHERRGSEDRGDQRQRDDEQRCK